MDKHKTIQHIQKGINQLMEVNDRFLKNDNYDDPEAKTSTNMEMEIKEVKKEILDIKHDIQSILEKMTNCQNTNPSPAAGGTVHQTSKSSF